MMMTMMMNCYNTKQFDEWWKFVHSFHQGRRLTVGSLSTCLQLPPALRP